MSTRIMALCWPIQASPTMKAVLISLADNANDQGYCWPSITTIAERTCLSERTVRRAIADLEGVGFVEVDRSNGRHSKYHLTINPGQSVTPVRVSPRSECPPTPDSVTGDPGQSDRAPRSECPPNRQEPSMNRQEPSECGRKKRIPKKKSVTKIVTDFAVSDRVRKWAAANDHPDPERCLEGFVLKAQTKNYEYADWDAAFMVAIRERWAGVVPDDCRADDKPKSKASAYADRVYGRTT